MTQKAAGITLSSRQGVETVFKSVGYEIPIFTHMNDNPTLDSPFGSSPSISDPFQAAKASALKAADELRHAAAQKATDFRQAAEARAQQFKESAGTAAAEIKEKAGEFKEYADETWQEARARCSDLRTEAEKFAREKPLQALLTAFGVGFVVGLILRR